MGRISTFTTLNIRIIACVCPVDWLIGLHLWTQSIHNVIHIHYQATLFTDFVCL